MARHRQRKAKKVAKRGKEPEQIVPFAPAQVPASQQGSRLLSIPQEIVDEILIYVVHSGSIAVLQTCQQVLQWSMPLMTKHGIFRMRAIHDRSSVGPYSITPISLPSAQNEISNIEITVDTKAGSYGIRHDKPAGVLASFTGSCVHGKICRIVLQYGMNDVENGFSRRMLRLFASLVGFETLIVEVEWHYKDYTKQAITRGILARQKNKPLYAFLRSEFEGALGEAVWKDGDVQGGRYLEFYPRAHRAKLAQ